MAYQVRNMDDPRGGSGGSPRADDGHAPFRRDTSGAEKNVWLPPLSFLVAALFCFAWRRFDGVVLLLGLVPFVVVGISPSPGSEIGTAALYIAAIKRSRSRLLVVGLFALGVAAGALVRAVDLVVGGSLPRAATGLERWGVLLLTLPIPAAYAVDGLFCRAPGTVAVGGSGMAIALAASWLGLAWKDALALTFAGLALPTAIAGAVPPEPRAADPAADLPWPRRR